MKPFWESKTIIFNALALILYVAQQYYGFSEVPALDPALVAVINFVLRFFTNRSVSAKV